MLLDGNCPSQAANLDAGFIDGSLRQRELILVQLAGIGTVAENCVSDNTRTTPGDRTSPPKNLSELFAPSSNPLVTH